LDTHCPVEKKSAMGVRELKLNLNSEVESQKLAMGVRGLARSADVPAALF
jgi:hypothetical protein